MLDDLGYPNGIILHKGYLYFTTFRGDTLYRCLVNKDGTVSEKTDIRKIKGGDNITRSGDNLIITNHPKPGKFYGHFLFGCDSPSSVYSYNTLTKKMCQIFSDKGDEISGSSTAIKIDKTLYVSQVFENYILKTTVESDC